MKKRKSFLLHTVPMLLMAFVLLVTTAVPAPRVYGAPDGPTAATSIAPGTMACVNFLEFSAGESVEGLGTVHPLLDISSTGNAVILEEGNEVAAAYGAPNAAADLGPSIVNNGVAANGGFADQEKLHEYTFSFAPGVSVNFFSIKMLDFGDYNSVGATEHQVELVAFDDASSVVDTDLLAFTSDNSVNPTTGSAGDLQLTGDAITALPQEPGNYTFAANGAGITSLEMHFSHNNNDEDEASDPNLGLAVVCFQTESELNTNLCVDFVALEPGQSVEGLGTLHPDLNISTSGNAVAVEQNVSTGAAYGAPNAAANLGASIPNNGVGNLGGFADLERIHDYQFSFSPGYSVDLFTVKMLDYGDYNKELATEHEVSLLAYDEANNVVSSSTLAFTSDGVVNPTTGSAGNLQLTGDAVTALPQQPGNYSFSVQGSGITRLEMQFNNNAENGTGVSDPNFAIAVLCFVPEEPEGPDVPTESVCMDFNALAAGTSVETPGILHPDLLVSSTGNTVAIHEGDPTAAGYGAPNAIAGFGDTIVNNGVGPLGGFVDLDRLHEYGFSFLNNRTATSFTVRMLDYGDYNLAGAEYHNVELVAYDADGNLVDAETLEFTSDASVNPSIGTAGNLQFSGDAITAFPQEPGNFIFTVEGSGITDLALNFTNDTGEGHQVSDPNFSLAVLCFELEDEPEEPELDPPTVVLDLLRSKTEPHVGGLFNVSYSCSETAPNLVSAEINGYAVQNTQNVGLVVQETESIRMRDGWPFIIYAPEFNFTVTCADDAGNETSTTIQPVFTP